MTAYVLWLVILIDDNVRLTPASTDLDGSDFSVEPAVLLGCLCLLVRSNAVVVLAFTVESMLLSTQLSLKAHVFSLIDVCETVLQDAVNQCLVAELGAGS